MGNTRFNSSGLVVRALTLGAAVLVTFATSAAGQTTTGAVRGYARDQAGAPIEGAQITARNVQMNVPRNTVTNASGFYNVAGLRPAPMMSRSGELASRRRPDRCRCRSVRPSTSMSSSLRRRRRCRALR